MPTKKLLPEERERLKRFLKSTRRLSRAGNLSPRNAFILHHRMRVVLQLLGAERPTKIQIDEAILIMRDGWPFKTWRLKKLIYG